MKKLIVGNWKCNPATLREARQLFQGLAKFIKKHKNVEAVVCPPHVFLPGFNAKTATYKLGVQNIFWEDKGAFTGEVGPRMAKSSGASYAIIGHSERREHFGETNDTAQKRVRAALAAGLRVILCVGERTREGEAAAYASYVKEEVAEGLRGLPKSLLKHIAVAYEPIWAIGSDEPDTPQSTLEMAIYIRKTIADMYGRQLAQNFPVLYGGSVNGSNARVFLRDGGVDGLLVGRASLNAKEFGKIVEAAGSL